MDILICTGNAFDKIPHSFMIFKNYQNGNRVVLNLLKNIYKNFTVNLNLNGERISGSSLIGNKVRMSTAYST